MLFAVLVTSAVLLEAALAAHHTLPEESPWGSAAHQGIRLTSALLPRLKSFAEKRHQGLLPYHPVVRFRGLGGPGDAWPDTDLSSYRPLASAGSTPVNVADLDTLMGIIQEARGSLDAELREALNLNAGDLLKALETLASKDDTGAKGIRFGIRR